MCKKLICLISFVLVLALACTNAAFGGFNVDIRVAATNDDAEEKVVGNSIELSSSDLELGHEGVASPDTLQIVGVRFTNVGIPKGVTIKKAWVQFTADDVDNEYHLPPVSLIIEGELSPDPVEFSSTTGDISSRARTTASVVWDIPVWGAAYSAGPDQQTADISPIIRDIIDQDGWAAGNAMVLMFRDNPDKPSQGTREAEAFDGDKSQAPLLHIEYTVKYATEPNPADGATGGPAPLLQWAAGSTTVYHDVYFGTNPDLGPADYMGRWTWAMYWHIPGLTPGTTYYWRVDEVEADGTTVHTGDVWSFMAVSFTAHSPDPPDGNKTASPNVVLSWGAGSSAATHDVYFGTSRTDVAAGTGGTFKGNQMDETYTPEGLQNGTTYYWRIDEVAADGITKHPGEVWSFRTREDPTLVGWWKLDEGQGNIAFDSSGYGNHGSIGGDPQWVYGAIDGGLELDGGDDYISIDSVADYMTNNNFTVSAWIKTNQEDEGVLFGSNTGSSHNFLFGVNGGNVWVDDGPETEFPPPVNNNQWHMVTYVRDGLTAWIYVDGVLRKTDDAEDEPAQDVRWSIGMEWDSSPSDEFEGVVDDARFYIRPLTAEEVAEIFRGDVDLAHSPSPANNSILDVEGAKQPLTWSPGEGAAQHDVYFGTDELSVEGANASDMTGIYRGRQTAASYTVPEALEWGSGSYYWRIDEYNADGTVSKGRVWSFTVGDFLIVEDFESYNDLNPGEPGSNRIFMTWMDGYEDLTNGSVVGYADAPFCEQNIVHSGRQSMPLFYNNSGPANYSEAKLPLSSQRDWTREGVKVLTLWFYGDTDNAPEQMYVAVANANRPTAVVYQDDPNASLIEDWTEWNINLEDLSNEGVVLTNVDSIAIGFGDRNNPQAGGSGMVLIDDIRLYRPATEP